MKSNSAGCVSSRRLRLLMQCGTALPLLALTVPAQAGSIVQSSSGDITVNEPAADGTPVAVDLSSTDGSIDSTVTTVTGTTQAGDRAAVVSLETGANTGATGAVDSITGSFDSITATGAGEVLGLFASSNNGDVNLTLGTVDVDGAASSGVYAASNLGDVLITGDSVIARGTGEDSQQQYYEGVYGTSQVGSVTLDVTNAESYGTYGSAIGANAGDIADVTVGTATAHGDNTVAAYAIGTSGASLTASSLIQTAANGGQGAFVVSSNGDAFLHADSISVGNLANGAVIQAGGNATAEIGTLTGGAGLYINQTGGDATVTAGTITTSAGLNSGINVDVPGAVSITSTDSITLTGPGVDPGVRSDGYRKDQGGIVVQGGDAAISIDAKTVNVEGEYRYGITARGNGAITIGAADVTLASADSVAVVARGGAGDVSITTGNVTTTGASGVGIFGNTTSGNVMIDAGTTRVENTGLQGNFTGDAITGIAGTGSVTITSTDAYSAALYGSALVGIAGGDVTLTSGTATTTGNGGVAVYGNSSGGNVSLTADTIIANSNAQGAFLSAAGMVTANINSISSGHGLYVNQPGSGAVDLTIGTAEASNDRGTAVHVKGTGDISIKADTVNVTGAGADPGADANGLRNAQGGIVVESGDGQVTVDAGTVTVDGEYRSGVEVRGNGVIDITAGDVTLASADAVAVVARGGAGDVSITTGNVTTTGASGVGVFGTTTSGKVTVTAGKTVVENTGQQGKFTGDAVVGISDNGAVSVTSTDATSHALWGSAVVGLSAGDVTVNSGTATTTGDGGVAVYASSSAGNVTANVDSTSATGNNIAAVQIFAANGDATATIGDVTAGKVDVTGEQSTGVYVVSQNSDVTINGAITAANRGLIVSGYNSAHTVVNGSITSREGSAFNTSANNGLVDVAQGGVISGMWTGLNLLGNSQPGLQTLNNAGTIESSDGVGIRGQANIAGNPVPDIHIRNDGTISGAQFAVQTDAGADVLELTENSMIDGTVDLGAGTDSMKLAFNQGAAADAVGQVASTVNVEGLSVVTGNWRAAGARSAYNTVSVADGATLTVAENSAGEAAIASPDVALDGTLNLELTTDVPAGNLTGTLFHGAGSLHLTGGATVNVDDASGFQQTGGTFVDNGTLVLTGSLGSTVTTTGSGVFQLGDGGTIGDFTGDLVDDGTFHFNRSDDYSLTGTIGGAGSIIKDGAGTLTFAGLYEFIGTTQVNAGTIAFAGQLAPDSTLDLSGSGTVDLSQITSGTQTIASLTGSAGNLILGTTDLVINQSGDTQFGGSITGTGTLTKEGTGDLKLNGDSTFSGSAYVNGGTLSVNGSYSDATFYIGSGGTLGGNGLTGATVIDNGSIGAGNSIGHLTIAGDLTLNAGSTLVVEVDPAGNADLVDVTGVATLGGASVSVLAGPGTYAPVTDYTILTAAGGLSGTFGTVTTNLAYLVPLLSYTVDTVSLRLSRNDVDYSAYASTSNQAAVGNLIEALGYGTTLYDTTLVLQRSQVATDFDTLTGGVYPTYGAAMVETADMVRRQMMNNLSHGDGFYGWGTGLLGRINGSGKNGLTGYSADNKGIAGGLGYSSLGFDVSGGIGELWQDPSSSQISDSKVTFATAQLTYSAPIGVELRAGVQFGWFDAKSTRQTTLGTISDTLKGAPKGDYTEIYGEVSSAMSVVAATIEPFVGLNYVSLNFDRFSEAGGSTALIVDGMNRNLTFADLGLRLGVATPGGIQPYGSVSLRHAWGDRASKATVAFSGNTVNGDIAGLPIARDSAELEGGLRYSNGRYGIDLGYRGSFSKSFNNNNVKLTVSVNF